MTERVFPKADGDILYGSEANILALNQIYTGTGFDCSAANNTVTNSVELTALTATQIQGANYVKITVTYSAKALRGGTPDAQANAQLKIQAKETGGAYGDEFAYKIVCGTGGGTGVDNNASASFIWFHTLTSGEKTNGVQFKIFGTAEAPGGSSSSNITNIQTVVEIKG